MASSLTTLLHTHVLSLLPSAHHLAVVCSSGSQGYHALKEMIQNGIPGDIVLLESCDVREVVAVASSIHEDNGNAEFTYVNNSSLGDVVTLTPAASECCLIYVICPKMSMLEVYPEYTKHIPSNIPEVTIYTNMGRGIITGCLLSSCKGLSSINLAPLADVVPKLTTIERSFLTGTGLKSIDLQPLSTLTDVGSFFLHKNVMLTSINLTPLSNLRRIKSSFLSDCTALTEIDLTPLSNVVEIEWFFFKGCSGLKKIDLAPLSQLTQLMVGFLQECSGLTEINLSPMGRVTIVGRCFLQDCSGLKNIDLTPLSHIKQIHASFLQGCSGLTEIDLSPLSGVTSVHKNFLSKCSGLETINLTPLFQITRIQSFFLSDCTGLTEIDLGPLSKVIQIDQFFLSGCTCLTGSIDLSPLLQVQRVDSFFLEDCEGLHSIDLSSWVYLEDAPEGLHTRCGDTTELTLPQHLVER